MRSRFTATIVITSVTRFNLNYDRNCLYTRAIQQQKKTSRYSRAIKLFPFFPPPLGTENLNAAASTGHYIQLLCIAKSRVLLE